MSWLPPIVEKVADVPSVTVFSTAQEVRDSMSRWATWRPLLKPFVEYCGRAGVDGREMLDWTPQLLEQEYKMKGGAVLALRDAECLQTTITPEETRVGKAVISTKHIELIEAEESCLLFEVQGQAMRFPLTSPPEAIERAAKALRRQLVKQNRLREEKKAAPERLVLHHRITADTIVVTDGTNVLREFPISEVKEVAAGRKQDFSTLRFIEFHEEAGPPPTIIFRGPRAPLHESLEQFAAACTTALHKFRQGMAASKGDK